MLRERSTVALRISSHLVEALDELVEVAFAPWERRRTRYEDQVVGAAVFLEHHDVELDGYAVELSDDVRAPRFSSVERDRSPLLAFDFDVEDELIREDVERK